MRTTIATILLFLFILPTQNCVADTTSGSVNHAYVLLKKNKPFVKQVKKEHTIYEIRDDYDLQGTTINIPYDCILKFEGGCLSNGSIVFDKTIIVSEYRNVFRQTSISGNIANHEVRLSWWELKYSPDFNDATLINQVVKAIDNCVLYYDIQNNVYVGGDRKNETLGEIIHFVNKRNLRVIQPTECFTILRGRSKGGEVVRCANNNYVSLDGLKVDGANITYSIYGENGIGVVGNEKVLIENCIIKNCFSNCFDKAANGTLTSGGYPEWGTGGKGIQIEGGTVSTQATIRNNSISNCYIGISNNASHLERVMMDGNFIDSCYMSMILLRLTKRIKMSVNISNTIITNNTGDVGVICMGDVENVNVSNMQVRGEGKVKSVLRGCFSNSNIQMIVDQPCENLIDAALYRDNPEGEEAVNNHVRIISSKSCDYIINTSSSVVPKKNGATFAKYVGGEFDVSVREGVNKTPIVLPSENKTTQFKVRMGEVYKNGTVNTINSKKK